MGSCCSLCGVRMNNIAEIKRRLASVKQTRQITGAMETISVAKMRRATERYESNKPYFDALFDIAEAIATASDGDSVLFSPPKGAPLYIVIASDRGLCGSFNHDVFKTADGVMPDNSVVSAVGITAVEHYKTRNTLGEGHTGAIGYEKASEISKTIMSVYGKTVDSVYLIYTALQSKSVYAPTAKKLLPFDETINGKKDDKSGNTEQAVKKTAVFEPSAEAVLEKFVPLYLSGALYGAMLSSEAAEHLARRAAMSASTDNADAMIAALTAEQNSVRQSSVTEQITEIIGSTRALNKERL